MKPERHLGKKRHWLRGTVSVKTGCGLRAQQPVSKKVAEAQVIERTHPRVNSTSTALNPSILPPLLVPKGTPPNFIQKPRPW